MQRRHFVTSSLAAAAAALTTSDSHAQTPAPKGREYYEKGRTQWSQYVEKGKNLVNEQQAKVGAAVDAGNNGHRFSAARSVRARRR